MSWNQQPPVQRYTAVPGFERPNSGFFDGSRPSSGAAVATPPGDDRSTYELDNAYNGENLPPAHRASIYSDPFTGGSRPSSVADNMSMNSSPQRPQRGQYHPMGDAVPYGAAAVGAGAGAGAGAAAGYPRGGGGFSDYQSPSHLGQGYPNARDSVPADQLWAMDQGKERVQNYSYNAGNEKPPSRKKWWIIAGLLLLIVIVVAVVVPVVLTQSKGNKGKTGSGSGTGTTVENGTVIIGDDPSDFKKDERLHNVFWGMAYQPDGAIPPECGISRANVTRDVQLLSQLTKRLRLYGSNCNVTAIVLEAIQKTKVDLTIYPAIYLDSNEQAFTDQVNNVVWSLKTYGADHVEGIAVGNEYLLNDGVTNGYSAPTGAAYLKAVSNLSTHIQSVNKTILALGLDKHIPIGTGDAGSLMSTALGQKVDFFMANVHPWFGGVPISDAAAWTNTYFEETDVAPALLASNKPATYIAETGWPTNYMAPVEGMGSSSGASPSEATEANLQKFLNTFVCQANTNNTHYFYFEPFDQLYKAALYGGVEPYWGLFDSERNLKNIEIPTC